MKEQERFSKGDQVRHSSRGFGIVVEDDGGPEVVVQFLTPDKWENTDTLLVSRESLTKISSKKGNRWER
jgi:hypothetical protein